jgi:pimeloyl-ACP methyl ester carboxylesterase
MQISQALRRQNPDVPLFLVGESLGGALALRLAARNPDLYDGLILAAPAIRHRYHVSFRSVADTAIALAMPNHEIDFSPYIKNYFSDESAISSEEMDDPLVRKKLRLGEIFSSCRLIAGTTDSIRKLPPNLPMLIIQGQKDLMIGRRSLSLLKENLPGNRANIQMFNERGHILLETAHVHPEVVATVKKWIDLECAQPLLSRRATRGIASSGDVTSNLPIP